MTRRKLLGDDPDDVGRAPDRLPVDRHDHVPAADELLAQQLAAIVSRTQARRGAGRVRIHARDHSAVGNRVAKLLGDRRDQILGLDADEGIRDAPGRDQLRHRAACGVDRHGEADALGAAAVATDLGVDSDHPSTCIEERAAGVAVVDRRVGLDRVDEAVARGQ